MLSQVQPQEETEKRLRVKKKKKFIIFTSLKIERYSTLYQAT